MATGAQGITGFGAYVPRYRISRRAIAEANRWMTPAISGGAKGSRAFCCWDEDAITMAVEAARDCLRSDARPFGTLVCVSTTAPYADLQSSAIAAAALGLPASTAAIDVGGSQRAATSALIRALDQEGASETLIVAADRPNAKPASAQELSYGAGAGAVRVGRENLIARHLASASVVDPFVDHFRAAGEKFDYFWEERWIRDEGYGELPRRAVDEALRKAGISIDAVHHLVMAAPLRGATETVARAVGFKGAITDPLDADCGYAGCAHVFLMLGRVLETAAAGEVILVVGFGQGADAILLEATGNAPSGHGWQGVSGRLRDRLPADDYLRFLSFYGNVDLEWGMRAEKQVRPVLTEAYRSSDQVDSFHAFRCRACGTAQFPRSPYCVNPACRAPSADAELCPLADEPAQILTITADWLTYHPAPPLLVGFVQFDNGVRLLMETVDADPAEVGVGAPVRMVFRIKERDRARGYNRYFWKATPASRENQ